MLSRKHPIVKVLSKKSGFTLTEILVAVGIMAVLAGLFASSVLDLKVSESEFSDKSDVILFINSLSSYMLSNQTQCTGVVTGANLPAPGADAAPFIVNGYNGYGANGGQIKTGSVISGTANNIGLRVKNISLQAKNVHDAVVRSNGVDYKRRVAQITITLERRLRKQGLNQFVDVPDHVIEFPVYVDAGNVVNSCQLEMQPADVCQMIGATVNPAGTACTPAVQCQLKGTYATSTCSPAYGGCPPSISNPVTGGTSCPAGVTATKTGEVSGTFTVSCGKKCTQDITNTFRFFICMQCN